MSLYFVQNVKKILEFEERKTNNNAEIVLIELPVGWALVTEQNSIQGVAEDVQNIHMLRSNLVIVLPIL